MRIRLPEVGRFRLCRRTIDPVPEVADSPFALSGPLTLDCLVDEDDDAVLIGWADGFYKNPCRVRQLALDAEFSETYTGERVAAGTVSSHPPVAHLRAHLEAAMRRPGKTFVNRFQFNAGSHTAHWPHHDPVAMTGVVYLSEGHDGEPGTSFCCHAKLRMHLVSPEAIAGVAMSRNVSPGEVERLLYAEITDPSAWLDYAEIDYRFNRLVLFNGALIHRVASFWGNDQADARLVHALFLWS